MATPRLLRRTTATRCGSTRPAFEHFTLAEITTGRVEWFLKSQAAISSSRARQSRTLLNLLFGFALRNDAIPRNPVGRDLAAAPAVANQSSRSVLDIGCHVHSRGQRRDVYR